MADLQALCLKQPLVVCNRAPRRQVVGFADAVQQGLLVRFERSLAGPQHPEYPAQTQWKSERNRETQRHHGPGGPDEGVLASAVHVVRRGDTAMLSTHLWHHVTMMILPPGAVTRASSRTN